MKRFNINEQGVGTYVVDPKLDAVSIDLNKVFEFGALTDLAKRAVAFAVGHVFRNATAGKMDDVAEARKAVVERAEALAAGKWSAGREGGEGESRTSLLAQALAAVMGVDPKDAAAYINGKIDAAKEEKGIDPEGDSETLTKEQQTEGRKIANAIRKAIGEDPGVAVELAKLKAAKTAADLAAKQEAAKGKTSAFAK